jgi:L-ascorbate metabolism protein UlaG (beta-lactamase superfamily)
MSAFLLKSDLSIRTDQTFIRYYGMISAFQKDDALLADIETMKNQPGLHIWWLGQSGFLLLHEGKFLLFDPYLSDSLTKKYEHTAKPHVRMSERAVNPARLNFIDVVTSSHNHTDHLDAETLIPILNQNTDIQFIIPEANRAFVAERAECDIRFPLGINIHEKIQVHNFVFSAVPAAHNDIELDAQGFSKYLGYVVQTGRYTVYHSGDTLWYEGMAELLAPFKVDIAFLPINGNDPARGVAGNLNAQEAAELGKAIGAKWVIPHHFDMFEFNTADPADFAQACMKAGQPFKILKIGERFTL